MKAELPIVLALLVVLSNNQNFEAYSVRFKKIYANETERAYRESLYLKNWAHINEVNSQGLGYTLGENAFTDLTQEEVTGTANLMQPPQGSRTTKCPNRPTPSPPSLKEHPT
jgi:peptidoglycan hydrolase-like amidase